MNIRLKRIIKIGLPLIIFLINICSAAEEENEKKNRAILISLREQGIQSPQMDIISCIEDKDIYLEEYVDEKSNEKKYRVREQDKGLLKVAYDSLLEENKKVNLNNNDEVPLCTYDCNEKEHMMKLPTCNEDFCKYAFLLHLQAKLSENRKIISCPKHKERTEGDKGHLCSFSLGKDKTIKDSEGVKKLAEINEALLDFLAEFGDKIIGQEDGKDIYLRDYIKKIILGGASDKEFHIGEAKKCMYCQNTLKKKNCINESNKIQCSGCGEIFICFKCLRKWDDSGIDHEKCIDSIDCDLFKAYGKGEIFVGPKNEYDPNDNCYENFETNKYYHPRRCYNCKEYVGKDRACNHATCPCGAQWCWFCGAPYNDSHWNENGNCQGLHFKGDYNNNFDSSLNERMQLKEDDLLPWERNDDHRVSKEEIQNFLNIAGIKGKDYLNQNKELCCDCCSDCLDNIKNCFLNF